MADETDRGTTMPSVAVVITSYNHAHFLADAIASVLAQTHRASEIIVVDDGSTDDVASVVARYPAVKLVRQSNQGLAAARNRGLHEAHTDKVIFLDADDRLLPHAVAAGLGCFGRSPACGFVYGGYRRVFMNGHVRSEDYYNQISAEPYRDFLRGNLIGMHATVMYDRARLIAGGGFDPTLPRCEDYDVYLRLSRSAPVASHRATVAEYRWHGDNMSANHREMLDWTLRVHSREAANASRAGDTAADWRGGRLRAQTLYVGRMLDDARAAWTKDRSVSSALRHVADAIKASPTVAMRQLFGVLRRLLERATVGRFLRWTKRAAWRPSRRAPGVGSVRFGDLNRVTPVSTLFGFERGTPVDRFYIEQFLGRHAADITGRVLEAGSDAYCRRFGGAQVTRQDVLNVSPDNPHATIVGDLSTPHTLPEGSFDCLLLTQTLQYIFDMRSAVEEMHRALRPGGVLLLTVPGVSQIERGAPGTSWCWSFTPVSVSRLLADVFGAENIRVESHGNVYAAAAGLYGLAVEDVDKAALDVHDPAYPVIVTVRARKVTSGNHGPRAPHPPTIH